jgi:hypothetical protein
MLGPREWRSLQAPAPADAGSGGGGPWTSERLAAVAARMAEEAPPA